MSESFEPGAGSLFVVERDGKSFREALSQVTISNGLAWSADAKTMYYIDTPTKEVWAFDYDVNDGQISNKRTAFAIPEGTGLPDGCCMDSQGNLWVAQWGGSRVVAYNPLNGSIVAEVHLPASNVTSVTFGGENLQDLYITTARRGLTDEKQKQQNEAGDIFMVKNCGFQGVPACKFA